MHTRETIKQNILNDNRWLERAIMAIYRMQTDSEKINKQTEQVNNVGFNSADARLGSYYATYIMKGNRLSGHHIDRARKLIIKYAGQLENIANGNRSRK